MALSVSAHAFGQAAEDALITAVRRAKTVSGEHDPLAPLTIVIPDMGAGYHIRRLLGRRFGGVVNVLVKPLNAVLDLVGSSTLTRDGRRPLPDPYRAEVIRAVAESSDRIFGDVPVEGALLRTLEERFSEFDRCEPQDLDQLRSQPGLPADLLHLYDQYRHSTRDFFTRRDLATAATEALADQPAVLRDIGALIVYLPDDLQQQQRRFLDELASIAHVEVILGLTGDLELVDAHNLAAWGLDPEPSSAEAVIDAPTAQRIVQAPDAEEEVRSAVREIAAALVADDPTPLHECAILFRHSEPYARNCAEQLDAAGLPWNGEQTTTLRQSMAGRILDGLAALMTAAPHATPHATPQATPQRVDIDWSSHVAPWLSAAPILDANGRVAPTARWNQLARRANLQRGTADWLLRLKRYRATLQSDLERAQKSSIERRPGRLPWIESELREIDALADFVSELDDFSRQTPAVAAWSDYADRARAGLDRLLGGRSALAAHTQAPSAAPHQGGDVELARWDDVQQLLSDLAALDELNEADPRRVAAALRRSLERDSGHHGRGGDGVYVGSLSRAVGQRWKRVYIVGSAEKQLPMIGQEDPLISDRLRDLAALPSSADRLRRERKHYLAALHAGEQRVLIYPRADTRSQQANLPGRWLLESATALNGGKRVYASQIDQAPSAILETIPSFERALLAADMPADLQERDLQSVHRQRRQIDRHYLPALSASFRRGIERNDARRSERMTRWDGWIGASGAEDIGRLLLSRPHSAGALQDWAACPYRYFLGRVLRIEERDEISDDLQISALDKGSLIHDIMDAFHQQTPQQPDPDRAWTQKDLDRLLAIAEQQLDAAREAGITGRQLLWRRDRRRILDDLQTLLKRDDLHRLQRGLTQQASELAFGRLPDSQGDVEYPLPDGTTLPLRGIIDRIDRPPSRVVGALANIPTMVIDYKTGGVYPRPSELNKDVVVRGQYLQLPVYAHAVRQLFGLGDQDVVTSAYWYITTRGDFTFSEVSWDAQNRDRFDEVLNLIADGIRSGRFPANPGAVSRNSPGRHCDFCSFSAICPADRREHWEQLRNDPRLAAYVDLAEPEEDDES